MPNSHPPLDNFSSRIKKVFIELKNYSYFHGPSEIGKIDRRFIGRRNLIKRFKAILSFSETQSGTYLITGYRGMGKSSFVSKVIDEASGSKVYFLNSVSRLITLLFLLFLIWFSAIRDYAVFILGPIALVSYLLVAIRERNDFKKQLHSMVYVFKDFFLYKQINNQNKQWNFVLSYAFLVSFIYLLSHYSKYFLETYQINLAKYFFGISFLLFIGGWGLINLRLKKYLYALIPIFLFTLFLVSYPILAVFFIAGTIVILYISNDYPKYMKRKLWQTAITLIVPGCISIYVFGLLLGFLYDYCELGIFFFILLYLTYLAILNIVNINVQKIYEQKGEGNKLLLLVKQMYISFESARNFSQKIYIKINLGYSGLRELDLLRLIAKNIQSKYKEANRSLRTKLLWKLLLFFMVYFITGLFYYHDTIYQNHNKLKQEHSLCLFLPSQTDYVLAREQTLLKDIITKLKEKDQFSFENYFFIINLLDEKDLPQPSSEVNSQIISDSCKRELDMLITKTLLDKHFFEYLDHDSLQKLPFEEAIDLMRVKQIFYKMVYESSEDFTLDELILENFEYIPESIAFERLQISSLLNHLNNNSTKVNLRSGMIDSSLYLNNVQKLDEALQAYSRFGQISSFKQNIVRFTSNIDLFIYINYSRLRSFLLKKLVDDDSQLTEVKSEVVLNEYIVSNSNISFPFPLIPYHLDYIFIMYFLVIWLVFRALINSRIFGYTSRKKVLQKLKDLNEAIEAQITTDSSANIGSDRAFLRINKGKTKSRPIATEREIETELIEIISMFKKLPLFYLRAEYVFIFDELDKIYPHHEFTSGDADIKNNNHISESSTFFSPEGTRKRQRAVLNLLSNLKYFLTSAKAKFIFIAGREMYDAYLADVSDRNFVIGSIFHEVLYMNSFLSEPSGKKHTDITSMTEEYVCQFIIPAKYEEYGYNLNTFNKYLIEAFPNEFGDGDKKRLKVRKEMKSEEVELEKHIARLKREKLLYLLQNFITYLTHISSGAPNKITSYFENYVSRHRKEDINGSNCLFVGDSSKNLCLSFNYYDQYKMNMINYLVTPVNLAIANTVNSVKSIGDKILVSTSFVIDHLFKFHRFGFSWRNIESTPEILDVTRSSELLDFISKIITYLMNSHIEEILTGLHTFKFPKKISQEIGFLSKVSEEGSALFNFVLDESLAVKQHYGDILTKSLAQKPESNLKKETSKYFHSRALVYMILGDLHFYDEEYGSAVSSYLDSIQELRNIDEEDLTIDLLGVLTRAMLKLGLALDKKKTYDSAFLIFGECASAIVAHWELKVKVAGENYNHSSSYSNSALELKTDNEYSAEESRTDYTISAFEGLKYFYQPLLAKFQIMEKSHLGGITQIDIERVEKEFNYLHERVRSEEKMLIKTEFWNKVGDMLYYKNSLFTISAERWYFKKLYNTEKFELSSDSTCKACNECKPNSDYIALPCKACQYYEIALINLLEDLFEKGPVEIVKKDLTDYFLYTIIKNIEGKKYVSTRFNNYKALANIISDYGDLILSCTNPTDGLEKEIKQLFDLVEHLDNSNTNSQNSQSIYTYNESLSKHGKVLLFYYLAAILYKKAGEHKNYSFQVCKILHCVRSYINVASGKEKDDRKRQVAEKLPDFQNKIVNRAIRALYLAYDSIHNYEIERYKDIFNEEEKYPFKNDVPLNMGSINTELDEIKITFSDLELLCLEYMKEKKEKKHYLFHTLISPYSLVSNMYNRILELSHKTLLNETIIEKFELLSRETIKDPHDYIFHLMHKIIELYKNPDDTLDKLKPYKLIDLAEVNAKSESTKEQTINKVFEFLLFDSIFCLREIIKLLNIYGKSFTMNHSLAGDTHARLMEWSAIYQAYLFSNELLLSVREHDPDKNGIESFFKRRFRRKENEAIILELIGKYLTNMSSNLKKSDTEIHTDLSLYLGSNEVSHSDINSLDLDLLVNLYKNEDCFEIFKKDEISQREVEKRLSNYIEPNDLPFIAPAYQAERAIKEYYMAIETHSEGKAYKKLIEDMYYLNDDYNDKMFHYSVANERYLINSGLIRNKINMLKKTVQDSITYNYSHYKNPKEEA